MQQNIQTKNLNKIPKDGEKYKSEFMHLVNMHLVNRCY